LHNLNNSWRLIGTEFFVLVLPTNIHMLSSYATFYSQKWKVPMLKKEASRHMLRRIAHFYHVIVIVDLQHSCLATYQLNA
jgi:hypothetical protein